FLAHSDGKLVAWRSTFSLQRADGSFEGIDIVVSRRAEGTTATWEWWGLNADATKGQYRAGTVLGSTMGWWMLKDTDIGLTEGRVSARQGSEWESQTRAPDNYLPEGTLELVLRLVAQQRTRAQFKLILNSLPPVGQTTRFARLLSESIDASRSGIPGAAAGVTVRTLAGGADFESTYFFDRDGRIIRKIDPDRTWTPVTRQQVVSRFDSALAIRAAVIRRTGLLNAMKTEVGSGMFGDPEALTEQPSDDGGQADRQGF
ncbi:unnamed protein product, partial [marine sediment metagenome]